MKKIFICLIFMICSLAVTEAQDYENSVGIRLGPSNGVSLKHFFSTNDAIEGIISLRWGGFNLTGLYERHQTVFNTDGMYFLYGAGGHAGFYDSNPWVNNNNSVSVIGIDGIIGLEYVFRDIPFNISLDYKPALNFIGYWGLWNDEVALSFRYIF
jgi:hypothetical protein